MSEPILVNLASVKSEPVKWLWPGRLPRGKVTLLCGDPGLGKSFVTMDIAARVTSCQPWPDGPTPLKAPGSVLVLSAEDDPGDTIRPRIEAAGGDASRVSFLEGVKRGGKSSGVALTVDIRAIETAIAGMDRPRLIIVDPISAYMGDADSNNNAEVRAVLAELSRLAIKWGPAILCVTHLNKSPGGKAVYRAMGSLAFTAAARIVWQVSKMPGDESRRAMALVKCNLPEAAPTITFRISGDEDGGKGGGRIQWLGTNDSITADFLSDDPSDSGGVMITEATEFLKAALARGPRPAAALIREAEQAGIVLPTLKRAKRLLGVRACKGRGQTDGWVWTSGDQAPAHRLDPLIGAGGGGGGGGGSEEGAP